MFAILTVANNYLVVLLYTTLTPPVCRYDPLVRLRLTPSSHRWLAGGAPTHSVTDTIPPLSKRGGAFNYRVFTNPQPLATLAPAPFTKGSFNDLFTSGWEFGCQGCQEHAETHRLPALVGLDVPP